MDQACRVSTLFKLPVQACLYQSDLKILSILLILSNTSVKITLKSVLFSAQEHRLG